MRCLQRLSVAAAASVLVLAACGGGDDPDAGGAVTAPGTPATEGARPSTSTPADTATGEPPSPTTTGAAPAGRPAAGTCVDVAEPPDGVYTVADAGTAQVRREEDRLVLGQVSPAEGWTFEVTDEEATEVEVEFRRGAEELDLELEIDDGRLKAEICADDD